MTASLSARSVTYRQRYCRTFFCNFHWRFICSSTCLCHSATMESHCYTIHQRIFFFFFNRLDTECRALALYFQDGHVQPFSPSFCLFLSAFNTGTSVKIYQGCSTIVFSSEFHLFSFSLLAFGFWERLFSCQSKDYFAALRGSGRCERALMDNCHL